jgi:hypothetical protein
MADNTPKTANIQALEVRKGKKQHLVAGMVYEVQNELAKGLIAKGVAVKANPSHVIGKIYDLPKGKEKNTGGNLTD